MARYRYGEDGTSYEQPPLGQLSEELAAMQFEDDEEEPVAKPPPPKPIDVKLADAQKHQKQTSHRANIGRIASDIAAAFGRYKSDDSFWDNLETQGKQGVAAVQAEGTMERQKKQDAQTSAVNDARIRNYLKEKTPKPVDPTTERLRQLQIKELEKRIDGDSDEALAEDVAAFEELTKTKLPKTGSRKGFDKVVAQLNLEKALEQKKKDRAAALEAKTLREKENSEKAADKAGDKLKGFYLEGYELSPDSRPRETEVSALRGMQASKNTVKKTIGRLEELYRKHGTEALPTEAKAEIQTLVSDLDLMLKGPDQYALGVLAGPDMGILRSVNPNPTDGGANISSFFGGDRSLTKWLTLGKQVDSRFEDKARALGYRRSGAGEPARAPMPAKTNLDSPSKTAAPVVRKAFSPSTGKTYLLDASGKKVGEEEGDTRGR